MATNGLVLLEKVDSRIHSLRIIHFSFIINVCYVGTAMGRLALSAGVGAGQVNFGSSAGM